MIETSLEPAPGRVLISGSGYAWTITKVHSSGTLNLSCPFGHAAPLTRVAFDPEAGEWIAADLVTVQVYARLTGVKLK